MRHAAPVFTILRSRRNRNEMSTTPHLPSLVPGAQRHWLWLLGGGGGVIVALGLAWFMFMLIQSGEHKIAEATRVQMLDFVRVKRSETVQRKDRRPQRPDAAAPPPMPSAVSDPAAAQSGDALQVSSLLDGVIDSGFNSAAIGLGQHDGEYLPIVKVAPIYPMAAVRKRLEGTCIVVYTVTTSGSVKDVRLEPGGCTHAHFERPSIEAAYKFKYKPRVIDGEAVEVKGIRNRFTYDLEGVD